MKACADGLQLQRNVWHPCVNKKMFLLLKNADFLVYLCHKLLLKILTGNTKKGKGKGINLI